MRVWNSEIDRRSFLQLAGVGLGAAALGSAANSLTLDKRQEPPSAFDIKPVLRIEPDTQYARVTFLSWDTEGGTERRQTCCG